MENYIADAITIVGMVLGFWKQMSLSKEDTKKMEGSITRLEDKLSDGLTGVHKRIDKVVGDIPDRYVHKDTCDRTHGLKS